MPSRATLHADQVVLEPTFRAKTSPLTGTEQSKTKSNLTEQQGQDKT